MIRWFLCWLSDLEAGKATAEFGLILRTLDALGLGLDALPSSLPLARSTLMFCSGKPGANVAETPPKRSMVLTAGQRVGVVGHDGGMILSFVLDPPLTDELRAGIVALWVEVTNAGGAVGFVAPVTAQEVWPVAVAALAGVAEGVDRLLIGLNDDRLVAVLFIADNRFGLKAHWRVLKRVMVLPGSQGRGYGAALLREAAAVAAGLGLEGLQVTVRDGHGLDRFYRRLGYREVGRVPGALRVGPGDDRDELLMWLDLRQPQSFPVTGSAAASATSA